MQVTLTQDAIIDGRRFPAGTVEMNQSQAKIARDLGVVGKAAQETESGDFAPEPKKTGGKKTTKTGEE